MKTELIWLQRLINTDLELFHIVLHQRISGNIYRRSSSRVLKHKEGFKIRSFHGHLQQYWTNKSKRKTLYVVSLREYDFRLVSPFAVSVLIMISAIVKKDFLSTFSDGR